MPHVPEQLKVHAWGQSFPVSGVEVNPGTAFIPPIEWEVDITLSKWDWPELKLNEGTDIRVEYPAQLVWEFPKERFVTYGPEDESWCRFFGIGREVLQRRAVEFKNCVAVDLRGDRVSFAVAGVSRLTFAEVE